MLLKNHLDEDWIIAGMKTADRDDLFDQLVREVSARIPSINAKDLRKRLEEREDESSTGLGHGVAIPHATIDGIHRTLCMIVQIPDGVRFGTDENAEVRLVFLLLSPPASVNTHIRVLARIARLLSGKGFVRDLFLAESPARIYELVSLEDDRRID